MRAKEILPEGWSEKYKRSIDCSRPKGFSQRAHCQGRKKDEDQHPNERPRGPETKPTMPAGTVRVDVSDVYDWYKLGQHISNLKGLGKHDFGKGPPSTILSFGSEDEEHQFIQALQQIGLDITDIDPAYHDKKKGIKTDPTYNVDENFAESATLNELFDKPYPIEDWDEEPDMVQADFTTEDGNRIMITYKKITQTAWEILFTIGYKDARGNFKVAFDKTGTGDAPRIFATVLSATATFVQKYKPAYVYFGGKSNEPSRVALYKTMIRQLSGKMGFAPITAEQAPPDLQAHMEKYKDHTAFILKNKAANVSENFADGKGPGRPGDSQRHGIPKGATIAQLEKAAKAKGRKGQLARWQLNMRRGKKK